MEAHEYRTLYEFESFYWWYKGLHGIILDTFRSFGLAPDAPILDAGCGTGGNLVNLETNVSRAVYGFDLSPHAAAFWPKRGITGACTASINEIPFPDCSFDALVSVDVLECEAVNETKACSELYRVLRPGGRLVLIVPAYDWMMNPEHHKAVAAVRRYSRKRLESLLRRQSFDILRITHVFGSVFPAVAVYRLADRFLRRGESQDDEHRSDLRPLPSFVNNLLTGVMAMERRVLKHCDIPFGSSIMATARKVS